MFKKPFNPFNLLISVLKMNKTWFWFSHWADRFSVFWMFSCIKKENKQQEISYFINKHKKQQEIDKDYSLETFHVFQLCNPKMSMCLAMLNQMTFFSIMPSIFSWLIIYIDYYRKWKIRKWNWTMEVVRLILRKSLIDSSRFLNRIETIF